MLLQNKFIRYTLGALGLLLGLLVTALVVGLLHRNAVRDEIADRRVITGGQGIDTIESVQIGGLSQYIHIRGHDRNNPVILFVHGGPGFAMMPFSHIFQDAWEDSFTVVQWDQRGAGKTYFANPPEAVQGTLTVPRFTDDIIEMTQFLRQRLGQEKIFLVGHSWGSIISVHAIKKRPDLYLGYVGTGQFVAFREGEQMAYQHTLNLAHQRGVAEAVEELEAIAPYPGGDFMQKFRVRNKWNSLLGETYYGHTSMLPLIKETLYSPDYSLSDVSFFLEEPALEWIDAILPTLDLRTLGLDFEVPVFFFEGAHEWQTPYPLVEDYYASIRAPVKNYVVFEKSSHFPFFSEPQKFAAALKKELLPLAANTPPTSP